MEQAGEFKLNRSPSTLAAGFAHGAKFKLKFRERLQTAGYRDDPSSICQNPSSFFVKRKKDRIQMEKTEFNP